MNKNTSNSIKLGSFVLIGVVFLIATLYLIGNNQNLFDRTFRVQATFYDVNGLMPGNNVRFSGINVGTVKEIQIINDTSVSVTMIIQEEVRKFIKKGSIASVGTDGLMGNKLINIITIKAPSTPIDEGDTLQTRRPVETDRMIRTLDNTNNNLSVITTDLKDIANKVNNSKALWNLLADTMMTGDIKASFGSLRIATKSTERFTGQLNEVMGNIKSGKGALGYLVADTAARSSIKSSLKEIREASTAAKTVVADLKKTTEKLRAGNGPLSTLLTDSTMADDLRITMHNVREGSERLNQNMEAMKHNFLFRGYFKKLDKRNKKDSARNEPKNKK